MAGGFCYGMASPLECELAEYVCEKVEGMEMVRFVNSGTEATMSAIRLARGFLQVSQILLNLKDATMATLMVFW